MIPAMEDCTKDLIRKLEQVKEKEDVDIHIWAGELTIDVIASVAFAARLGSQDGNDGQICNAARTFFRNTGLTSSSHCFF